MDFINLGDLISEIKNDVANKEYELAKMKIEEGLESVFITPDFANELKMILQQINELYLPSEQTIKELSADELFLKAFFLNAFSLDFFMAWVYKVIEMPNLELNAKQIKILDAFFQDEETKNESKIFVLENLTFLKINYNFVYFNKFLKNTTNLSVADYAQLAIYKQRAAILKLLEELAFQKPSILQLSQVILHEVYTLVFPMQISFSNNEMAQAIHDYVQEKIDDQCKNLFTQNNSEAICKFLKVLLTTPQI